MTISSGAPPVFSLELGDLLAPKETCCITYNKQAGAYLDDNRLPRHIWTFLVAGKKWDGVVWKNTGLNEFELAHVFAHKMDEREKVDNTCFNTVDINIEPMGLFTCATNVILIPKGLTKPTNDLKELRIVFFKRHLDLYGEDTIPGLKGFKNELLPRWYDDLAWNEPFLPNNWDEKIDSLIDYREKRLEELIIS